MRHKDPSFPSEMSLNKQSRTLAQLSALHGRDVNRPVPAELRALPVAKRQKCEISVNCDVPQLGRMEVGRAKPNDNNQR
jgi:hypothetical protein